MPVAFPGEHFAPPEAARQFRGLYEGFGKRYLTKFFIKAAKSSLYWHYTPPPSKISRKSSEFSIFGTFLLFATYYIQKRRKTQHPTTGYCVFLPFPFCLRFLFSKNFCAAPKENKTTRPPGMGGRVVDHLLCLRIGSLGVLLRRAFSSSAPRWHRQRQPASRSHTDRSWWCHRYRERAAWPAPRSERRCR